ncbi:MAG: hypothetical protein AAFX06_09910 [Planctomycetota bacterium]
MNRTASALFAVLCLAGVSQAQQPIAHVSDVASGPIVEEERAWDPWARFHGFLFRRFAGSVEMESKTRYPKGYFGRFTYLPWQPDWVRTPANHIRSSQYRHHYRNSSRPTPLQPEFNTLPVEPTELQLPMTTQPMPVTAPPGQNLEPVTVQDLN